MFQGFKKEEKMCIRDRQLHLCEESGIATGIDITKVIELSRKLKELLNHDMDSYILRAGRSCDLIQSNQD